MIWLFINNCTNGDDQLAQPAASLQYNTLYHNLLVHTAMEHRYLRSGCSLCILHTAEP